MTAVERAKEFIRHNGPYWRLLQFTSGVGFGLMDKYTGDESRGAGEGDLEEGLERFEKMISLAEGSRGRFQLYVKAKPQGKQTDERGPFGFTLGGQSQSEATGGSDLAGPGAQNWLGQVGLNPMELLHLQRETVSAGLNDQRSILQTEEALRKEYSEKHDKLKEIQWTLKQDQRDFERDKADWEKVKKQEEAELRELRAKYEERSEGVKNGVTQAIEGLLSGMSKGGGLAGLPATQEDEEEQLTPQEEIAGDLAQFLVDEMPDLKQLEAISQFIKSYVTRKKVSTQGAEEGGLGPSYEGGQDAERQGAGGGGEFENHRREPVA